MDALTSARRKIDRAHVHLFPLLLAVEQLLARSNAYATSKQYEPETRRYTFKIATFVGLDEINSGLMAADVVHNLRAALDHIVFGLANLGMPVERKYWPEITFPIEGNYRSFMAHSVVRFLTLEQLTVLERYQPFSGGDNKRLIDLHSLWNADKHRAIQPVLVALPHSGIKFSLNEDAGQIVDRGVVEKVAFDSNAMNQWLEMGWIEISAPGPKPDVDVDSVTLEIALGERRVPAKSLVEIETLVSTIVEAFAPFFPQPDSGL